MKIIKKVHKLNYAERQAALEASKRITPRIEVDKKVTPRFEAILYILSKLLNKLDYSTIKKSLLIDTQKTEEQLSAKNIEILTQFFENAL